LVKIILLAPKKLAASDYRIAFISFGKPSGKFIFFKLARLGCLPLVSFWHHFVGAEDEEGFDVGDQSLGNLRARGRVVVCRPPNLLPLPFRPPLKPETQAQLSLTQADHGTVNIEFGPGQA
jgi:hypothetical protein